MLEIFEALRAAGIWALITLIIIAYFRYRPVLAKIQLERDVTLINAQSSEIIRLSGKVESLEKDLRNCHDECSAKCDRLRETVVGMKMQRAQEQLTFIKMFPPHMLTPEMKDMVERLEVTHMAETITRSETYRDEV